MGAWFDSVDVFVEAAFDDTPLTPTASCTWVDITAYCRGVATNRGRTSELSQYSPGTASVILDNRTRVFDVSNTAGTYYGKLLPLKRIRVRAVVGATSAVLFAGYVTGWPVEYPGMVDSTVTVQCVDALRVCETSPLPGSAYEAAVLEDDPDHYWPMQSVDDIGGTSAVAGDVDLGALGATADPYEIVTVDLPVGANRALTTGSQFASVPSVTQQKAMDGWYVIGTAAVSGQWRVAVSSTEYLILAVAQSSSLDVSVFYSSAIDNRYLSVGTTTAYITDQYETGTVHHVAVTVDTTNAYIYVDGTLRSTQALLVGTYAVSSFVTGTVPGWSVRSGSNGSSHIASYPTAPSAARILAHYEAGYIAYGHPTGERAGARIGRILDAIGWPSADRDLATGETVLGQWTPGGVSALTEMLNVGDTEAGLVFVASDGDITLRDRQWQMTNARAVTAQATFDDTGSDLGYTDPIFDGNHIDWVRNVVVVDGGPAGVRTVKDQTSIDDYGQQSDNVSAQELPAWGAWLARQYGNFRLRARKDPATRVSSITVKARGDNAAATETRLAAILPLDLGDRVEVNRNPSGGAGSFALQCAMQGIAHVLTPGDWTVQMYLAPAPKSYTEAPYLTVGDATYGDIGVAAGNLVPY